MTCKPCAERRKELRDAFVRRRLKEMVKIAAQGATEIVSGKHRNLNEAGNGKHKE